MQAIVNQTLNSNPTLTSYDVTDDIDLDLPTGMMNDEAGIAPLKVQFNITIVPDVTDDHNASDLSKSRIWTKTGQSLGGKIIMGKSGDANFTTSNGSLVPAYYSNNSIVLNPQFYDKTSPNYTGFGEQSTTTHNPDGSSTTITISYSGSEGGVLTHEIGHDLGLNHPKGKYPKDGTMSTDGDAPTQKETEKIVNPKNSKVIQPGKKN